MQKTYSVEAVIEEDDLSASRVGVLFGEDVAGVRVAVNVAEFEDHVSVHLKSSIVYLYYNYNKYGASN